MGRTVAIGLQDFGDLIRKNYFYIDKTAFIKEWWESGFGRYDVVIEPKQPGEKDAFILEFQVHDTHEEETLKDTVTAALRQIEEKQYAAGLTARGVEREHRRGTDVNGGIHCKNYD